MVWMDDVKMVSLLLLRASWVHTLTWFMLCSLVVYSLDTYVHFGVVGFV